MPAVMSRLFVTREKEPPSAACGLALYVAVQCHSADGGVETDAPRVALRVPQRRRSGDPAARVMAPLPVLVRETTPPGAFSGRLLPQKGCNSLGEDLAAAAQVDIARGSQLDLAGGHFDDGGDVDLSRGDCEGPAGGGGARASGAVALAWSLCPRCDIVVLSLTVVSISNWRPCIRPEGPCVVGSIPTTG